MKLPNLDEAYVPPAKIRDYLLNIYHDEGSGKARFFLHFGFSVAKWEQLAQSLIDHAHTHDVVKEEITPFGIRYVVEGSLPTPDGNAPRIRVVWFISQDEGRPRLATAYPIEEQDD